MPNTPEVLSNKIDNLTKKVEDGFVGVHSRQDRTNGNISNNKKSIVKLEKEDIKIKNSVKNTKILWFIITTLVTTVAFFVGQHF